MNIFVAKLNFSTREESLKELFGNYGEVVSVRIIKDKETRKSKGYGFVEMADEASADAAIDALDETTLDGRQIAVKKSEPRGER